MKATGNRAGPDRNDNHWTDEIVEVADHFALTYKGWRVQATALLAIALLTLASLVGLARYSAPYYGYLAVSGTGLIFGVFVRWKRWRRDRELD